MARLDDLLAQKASLEASLARIVSVVTSGGRTVQYEQKQQTIAALNYVKQQIAEELGAATTAKPSCGYSGRQVRIVYGGRGY